MSISLPEKTSSFRAKFQKSSETKHFKYDLLPQVEITSETLPHGRFYKTPAGLWYPSVTTVLSGLSKPYIDAWRNSIGDEEADKIFTQACHRGTSVHEICEKYLLNDKNYLVGAAPFDAHNFAQIKNTLDAQVDNIRGIEYPLYSDRLKTAGRTDIIADYAGQLSIIDFKTSRNVKDRSKITHYFMQATTYAMMLKERINIDAKQIVIIMMVDHSEPIIFVEKTKDYLSMTYKYFKENGERFEREVKKGQEL